MSQQGLRNENNTDNGFLPEIDDCVSVLNKSPPISASRFDGLWNGNWLPGR